MIAFLAGCAFVGAVSSAARLAVAIVDYRRKWSPPPSYTWRKKT